MQVISSSQSIQLAHFPDLNVISKYGDPSSTGSYDFQFLRQSPLFIISNPEKPIEYLTKKLSNDKEEILFVRRIRTDIANTVACPNNYGFDIAVGTSTGYIQMHHYKTMEETIKFSPPNINDAVMNMSFNSQDDLLASLHESGHIQIFGLKTSVRTDLITFDKEVTHLRFHPKRKLHLGMVSYNGHIHIYDAQAKKKVFSHMAHEAPCCDLAMSPINDNCLVSVGYDHLLNLYDTRSKIASIRLSTAHPLSAVAISPCGNYSCVGNLKGQLLAYDFRQLKEPLIQNKQHHTRPVKRVEFIPVSDEELSLTEKVSAEPVQSASGRRDSMQSFFDHHYKRLPEQRKLSSLFSAENLSGTRISLGGTNFRRLLTEEETARSSNHSLSSADSSSSDVEFVGFTPGQQEVDDEVDQENTDKNNEPKTPMIPLARAEEKEKSVRVSKRLSRPNITVAEPIPEDEEQFVMKQALISRPVRSSIQTSTPLNSAPMVSTPTSIPGAKSKLLMPDKYMADGDKTAGEGARVTLERLVEEERKNEKGVVGSEVLSQLKDRMDWMEKQLEFTMEQNMWELKNYNSLIYMKQMDAVEELQRSVSELTIGMNCLIQSDEFINEFFRLRQENEELKARLMGNGH